MIIVLVYHSLNASTSAVADGIYMGYGKHHGFKFLAVVGMITLLSALCSSLCGFRTQWYDFGARRAAYGQSKRQMGLELNET